MRLNQPAGNKEPMMVESKQSTKMRSRAQKVYQRALNLYWKDPNWVTFFREILGSQGVVRQAFQNREELHQFEKTAEYGEIQLMLARLRDRSESETRRTEPTRVITVRMPKSLHEALQSEAFLHETSMNKLCITKLLQYIDGDILGQNPLDPGDGTESAGAEAR